ncbi:MAG: hypothetical protein ACOYNO_02505, partial [Saprospiraceae bacterium]
AGTVLLKNITTPKKPVKTSRAGVASDELAFRNTNRCGMVFQRVELLLGWHTGDYGSLFLRKMCFECLK